MTTGIQRKHIIAVGLSGLALGVAVAWTVGSVRTADLATKVGQDNVGEAQEAAAAMIAGQLQPSVAGGQGHTTMTTAEAVAREQALSSAPEAQPPKTYIGPDGKEYAIEYNKNWLPGLSPDEKLQLRRAMIEDMRRNPEAFAKVYALPVDEIKRIATGKAPFPDEILLH